MLRASRSFKLVTNRWKSITTPMIRSSVRKFSNKTEEKANSRGPVTYGSLAILLLGGAAAAVTYYIEKEEKIQKITNKVEVIGKPALGGEWVLVDQDGVPRSDASYHGKYTILYFGFTHCPDICPSELVKIGKILTQLGKISSDSRASLEIFLPQKAKESKVRFSLSSLALILPEIHLNNSASMVKTSIRILCI